jgi:cobalt/nickel transport system permease protein
VHVPDGFFNAATSLAAGAAGAGTIALSLRKAAADLGERLGPMAGLVSAFVFALQMVNFPVGAGTSGHLMGGALAAILVGPWTALLCIAIVLLVQALLFADGGLTAYGLNVMLIGVVPVFSAWGTFRLLRRALPAGPSFLVRSSAAAAFVSVPAAAAAFSAAFALGGTVELPFKPMLTAMVGTHLLIGAGEAFMTAALINTVAKVRPDLVHGDFDRSGRLVAASLQP